MSRYSGGGSYGHNCIYNKKWNDWDISWYIDRYYEGSRLRFPRKFVKSTDEKGAKRFCKKWKLEFPRGEDTE